MISFKSVYFIVPITIFLGFFSGKCLSYPSENVQFITKLAQENGEDWESDLIEPKLLLGKILPQLGDDVKNDQDIENTKLLFADEKNKEENVKEDIDIGRKRIVRQANYNAYSPIYPTLTPQNPMYRPAAGVHGNIPNNYPSNQRSYSNPGHSQPYYYPQGQNSFQSNTSYTNPAYNQASFYNNQSSNQQHYFNNRPSVNNSNTPFQGNFPQNGYNANRHTFTPTPTNQWTPGYATNNSRYNPTASNGVSPKYPSFNNPPNTFHNFNNSTPRNIINGRNGYSPPNPQYNPSNPYQSYPHNTNSQHNNYNGSNQWSSSSSGTQIPYNNPGNNYPYVPSDGRSSNVSRQNYPTFNPSSYPTNNNNQYNQQPYSPNSLPNPYSQNYPVGPNNQYNKEPDHFFYSPGQKDTRYDPRNGPSHNFSYTK